VGCYAVSAARLFLGEPDRAFAATHDAGDYGVDTKLAGILEYDGDGAAETGGAEAGTTAEVSCGFETSDVQFYRIEAENGWLEVRGAFVPRGEDGAKLEYEVEGRHAVETFDPTDQYRLEVEHFAECVESGADPRTDADEAVRNMQVIDALYESAEEGEFVEVGG
jgi:predicted dehydrogenase